MSAIVMLEGDGQTGEMIEMPGIGLENGHNKYPFLTHSPLGGDCSSVVLSRTAVLEDNC